MDKTRTYGVGRICKVEGCGTRLSSYNPSQVCALHGDGWKEEFHPGVRGVSHHEEMSRRCAFELCGREFVTTNPAKKYCSDGCRMKAFQARLLAARIMGDVSAHPRAS